MTNADEASCSNALPINYDFIKPPAVINFDRPGGFTITSLPEVAQCPDSHFQCHGDGYCLPVYVRCNDVNDCPDKEDEILCNEYTCPGFYRCRGSDRTICVHVNHLCDGRRQCPQHDDELMCDLICPESCICHGLAFTCTRTFQVSSFPQLRYLEAKNSRLRQGDSSHNLLLIHLGVQGCGWKNVAYFTLTNLHSLDLSDNVLHHLSFTSFKGLHNLQTLSLAGNPISCILFNTQRRFLLTSVMVFNFSRVQGYTLNLSAISDMMPNVQVLDLSQTGLESVQGQRLFKNLRILDLQGCPISDLTPDFMRDMNSLKRVFADYFKLCCSTVLPKSFQGECFAPSDEISSCDDLLKSSMYRFVLVILCLLSILGNSSSFLYRLFWSERINTGFAIFVLHLCISDLLMGVYLAIIGVADQTYAGIYVWSESAWKKSIACSIAGVLSFLSSEVSALFILVITLDRFLVLHFPFSQIRFRTTSTHIACVIIWTLGLTLAVVPLFPVVAHWEFYRYRGICIPLPITRADFAGHSYSFSIMIVFNLILFLMIAVGQSLIFYSVKSNAMSEGRTERMNKGVETVGSKETVIARRLLLIAMTDFLCWFPVGLCGLLAEVGVAIPGIVNVAFAIFVLPVNSALNPFIYTLNIMLERKQKAQEVFIQKMISAQLKNKPVYYK